jgi:hypothetical protein
MVQDVLHKQLEVCAYTVEPRREIKGVFPLKSFECAHRVLSEAVKVYDFLRRILSTDETSCHIAVYAIYSYNCTCSWRT